MRFKPSLGAFFIGLVAYLLIGVLYSIWQWFRECHNLRVVCDAEFGSLSFPSHFGVSLTKVVLIPKWTSPRMFSSYSEVLKIVTPKFNDHRGVVGEWMVLWAFFLLNDLTIDLIKTIQDTLKGIYQSIANNQFQA